VAYVGRTTTCKARPEANSSCAGAHPIQRLDGIPASSDYLQPIAKRGQSLPRCATAAVMTHRCPKHWLQLKTLLQNVHPAVWRRVRVVDILSIAALHHLIQVLMGWEDKCRLWPSVTNGCFRDRLACALVPAKGRLRPLAGFPTNDRVGWLSAGPLPSRDTLKSEVPPPARSGHRQADTSKN
jgi:hypothetical protein